MTGAGKLLLNCKNLHDETGIFLLGDEFGV
jgi:hypothetical protein